MFTDQDLETNEALLESVRKVQGGKYQFQIAQRFPSNNGGDILSDLNSDDERFSQNIRARRAWITASESKAKELLEANGADTSLPEQEGMENAVYKGVKNPTHLDGTPLKIRIEESVFPRDEYQATKPEQAAKRAGREGDLLIHTVTEEEAKNDSRLEAGMKCYIFSNTRVVREGQDTHTFVQHDNVPQSSSSNFGPIEADGVTKAASAEDTSGEDLG